ncbi:hypothetical protein WOLCODRAFT_157789 [Wolfiporia cocos MD-104 SS10]|uniref:Uncharacterized protein n=1 Tax=Wolfiporia cocos (strain MD-104) TaxID=742152 RepID=A0A2H3JM56_WOLCO|nr:hypothetical protein WOLCODRAFT_157789 [Wolfiporia cocos MD-104 SS10]
MLPTEAEACGKYFCTCAKCWGGKDLSRSTYYRHRQRRYGQPVTQSPSANLAPLAGPSAVPPIRHPASMHATLDRMLPRGDLNQPRHAAEPLVNSSSAVLFEGASGSGTGGDNVSVPRLQTAGDHVAYRHMNDLEEGPYMRPHSQGVLRWDSPKRCENGYGSGLHSICGYLEELRKEYRIMNDRLSTINDRLSAIEDVSSYTASRLDQICQSLPPSGASISALPELRSAPNAPLDKNKYPSIKYWNRENFLVDAKKNKGVPTTSDPSHDSRKPSSKWDFYEIGDGSGLTKLQVDDVSKGARDIYRYLHKQGRAPSTWDKHVDVATRTSFCAEMERRFPNLRLCSNSWKANEVALRTYSNWYKENIIGRGRSTAMGEDAGGDIGEGPGSPPSSPAPVVEQENVPARPAPKRSAPASQDIAEDNAPTKRVKAIARRDPQYDKITLSITTTADVAVPHTTTPPATAISRVPNPSTVVNDSPAVSKAATPSSTSTYASAPQPARPISDSVSQPITDGQVSTNASPPISRSLEHIDRPVPEHVNAGNEVEMHDARQQPCISNAGMSSLQAYRTRKVYEPGKRATARNLCGRVWLIKNPGGSSSAFQQYWKGLGDGVQENWKTKAKGLPASWHSQGNAVILEYAREKIVLPPA